MTAEPLPRPEDIRMICSDVDGTLLTSAHVVHERTVAAVRALRKIRPSLPFVLCTGKQLVSVADLRQALDLDPAFPAICCQGAVAYGPNGTIVSQRALDRQAVLEVIKSTQTQPFAIFVFVHDAVYLVNDMPHPTAPRRDWLELSGRYDKNIIDARQEPTRSDVLRRIESSELQVVKVTAACEEPDVPAAEALLRTHAGPAEAPFYHITRAISFILELVPHGITKESAIATLCASMGISIANVLAFGDGENDAGMLAKVGHGVAMGNAVPMTQAAARYQTLSNDEGGVGAFLERVYGLPSSRQAAAL